MTSDTLTEVRVGAPHRGQVVESILGQSDKIVVYTTQDKHLRWSYRANGGEIDPPMRPAVSRFDRLMTDIAAVVPARHRASAYAQLGKALFNVLDGGDPSRIEDGFAGVVSFVREAALEYSRLLYVIAFLVTTALLGPFISWAAVSQDTEPLRSVLTGGAFGMLGACVSVLQRSHGLTLDPMAGRPFILVQGGARAVLGLLFGVFIVLACKGELILAFAKDHPAALLPMAMIAGASERFVPEVMEQLRTTT